jgi:hypothetical protein
MPITTLGGGPTFTPAWSDSITQAFDWSNIEVLNRFVHAVNQRSEAVNGTSPILEYLPGGALLIATITRISGVVGQAVTATPHGFDVSQARQIFVDEAGGFLPYYGGVRDVLSIVDANTFTFAAGSTAGATPVHAPITDAHLLLIPTDAQLASRIAEMQTTLRGLVDTGFFVDEAAPVLVISTTGGYGYLHYETIPNFKTWETVAAAASVDEDREDDWQRRTRRRITAADWAGVQAAASDDFGNAALNGQIAEYSFTPPGGSIPPKGIVRRESGVWVEYDPPTHYADEVSSLNDAPDRVEPGAMQPGDFIGHWIWQELKAVCNQLRKTHSPVVPTGGATGITGTGASGGIPGPPTYASAADAKTAADGNWSVGGLSGGIYGEGMEVRVRDSSGDFEVNEFNTQMHYTVYFNTTTVTKTWGVYFTTNKPDSASGFYEVAFSGQGSGFTEGAVTQINDSGGIDALADSGDLYNHNMDIPPVYSGPSGPGTDRSKKTGWAYLGGMIAIMDWHFTEHA